MHGIWSDLLKVWQEEELASDVQNLYPFQFAFQRNSLQDNAMAQLSATDPGEEAVMIDRNRSPFIISASREGRSTSWDSTSEVTLNQRVRDFYDNTHYFMKQKLWNSKAKLKNTFGNIKIGRDTEGKLRSLLA